MLDDPDLVVLIALQSGLHGLFRAGWVLQPPRLWLGDDWGGHPRGRRRSLQRLPGIGGAGLPGPQRSNL